MASPERCTPYFFQKPWNSSWARDGNPSMHNFTNQAEQFTGGYSVNGYEPSYGTDVSLMKFALDISLDLNPKSVIDYLTSQNEPLIADVAPMHLRNDAPSEFANLTPTQIVTQSVSTGPVTVTEERNTNAASWLEREFRSFGAISDATQFAVDTSADLRNSFSPESASIEITDYFKQEQVESPPAFDRGPPNEQPIPADDVVVVDPFFDAQIPVLLDSNQPRSYTTRRYNEEPPYVYRVEGYGEQLSRHEILLEHLEGYSSDQTHLSSSDEKFKNNRTVQNRIGEKKFACDICKKKFTRHEGLKVHMTIHTGDKMFACPICGKNFACNGYLRKHMVIHTEEKKYACDVCSKEFARHTDLKTHMTIHTGQKAFACEICGKNFGRRVYLRNHMAVHGKEKTIKRKVSSKELTRDSYFKQPVTFHTEEMKFACDVCSKSFTRIRYLTQHMKVHTYKKEFGCDVCGKTFACRIHLQIHVVVHTKEKKFACDICNTRFGQKASLSRHRTIHTGVQKFACEICNRKIARYDNLIAHMKIHRNA